MLSPYIRHRAISETEVLQAVLSLHSPAAADKFIQEVFWRSYWKGWLEHRPSVWLNYQNQVGSALTELQQNAKLRERYTRAVEGTTAIEPMNAWVRELRTSGYLHNHARMWFASIWIFTLRLPWVLGADFFLRHLLDGDPASNTLSWRWVAGLHTKDKTYLATAENIKKFAAQRFFTSAEPLGLELLADQATPLAEAPPLSIKALDMAEPTTMATRGGLLLSEDDLHLDVTGSPHAVAVWLPEESTASGVSGVVRRFKESLCSDALKCAQQKWPHARSVRGSELLATAADIIAWVQRENLERVYAAYLPQGYAQLQSIGLQHKLAVAGCELVFITRNYDRYVWPHATKGYFRLKQKIPLMLEELGLTSSTN